MVDQVEGPQGAERHACRVLHRGRAAGHRDVREVREALEVDAVRDQDFAAPDGAVESVSGPVERDADDRVVDVVLRHGGHDVRMVVLHVHDAYAVRAAHLVRPFARQVFGMHVACDDGRLRVEE